MDNVSSIKRRCPKCDSQVHRLNGKWWCLLCRRFVKPKR